ncbi:ArsR family transcriptional regulator [Lacihabitans sp. LS3-19]|uniref:ArsR/SmtB family transcription factor n=1 Tax=Lacihabitans sp. LS3-19 TaxID=2487335 RepID=UPI0020CB93AA|nr:ArsR family transcriptional regulator [Lacihabitans sp. LS3-19]MCP9768947.1 ArsR family transcriptional regulator [Lacihabitans sp. LS3-19]
MSLPQIDSFQVIADPCRREILRLLESENKTISNISENFQISRPAISKHIKILETFGFLTIVNNGRERICTLSPKGFEEISQWIAHYENFWAQKMKNFENLLNQDL